MFKARMNGAAAALLVLFLCLPGTAFAHASEGAFVLLLPTRHYIAAGVAAVVLTLVLLAVPSIGSGMARLWTTQKATARRGGGLWTSGLSFAALAMLVHAGLTGPTDPLANPLVTAIWVLWWVILMLAQAIIGDLWHWIDPWRAPFVLLRRLLPFRPLLRLPPSLGAIPAAVLFALFVLFMIADPAPYDPRRLAGVVAGYWLASLAGMLVFGRRSWMRQCEFAGITMRRFAALAPLDLSGKPVRAGLPGWQVLADRDPDGTLSLFVLFMLGAGAYESLYTTFAWLAAVGVNPLEYPGRSALVSQTSIGLVSALALVVALFAAVTAIGQRMAGEPGRFGEAFRRQAQCTLPIVVAYHFAHYLTTLLVDGQYLLAALGDPWGTGADLFGLGHFHVTAGFLQTRAGAQAIWLSQAGVIVAGHLLAILLSHRVALEMHRTHRRALISQVPISAFMVAYTVFGLWLLASPRAV